MDLLSALHRNNIIKNLEGKTFDLVVIGGGITGAGIALDASSRGLSVALVEKGDFASGTSSKSTKLIHGGLRYLKQFEISLVREVGRERAIVHDLAPHLVTSEKMLLPLIKGGTYGGLATSMGLWVYDVLAGVYGKDKRKMLNKAETLEKEPLLREDILTGSGFYAEYQTDDSRLTIENIKTAASYGAVSLNYVQADDFLYQDEAVCGIHCTDVIQGSSFDINAKFVVNATGPWVDKLRKKDNSLKGKHLFLSKGVHIVVPHKRFPVKYALYFDVPDGRMIFAIPRNRITYIGTTDTPYEGDLNDIPINKEDVTYLIDAVNEMFPTANLVIDDVESSWAGLRPLIHEEGKSASEMSRKDELFISDSGLISIAGGKLTGYRKMSERVIDLVVDKVSDQNGKKYKDNFTDDIPLTGGPFEDEEEVLKYCKEVQNLLVKSGLPNYYGSYLVKNYGKQTNLILKKFKSYEGTPEIALARAEAWYSIHHELTFTLLDFYNRRTGRLYFNLPSIRTTQEQITEDFKSYFSWSEERLQKELSDLEKAIKRSSVFETVAN